MTIQAREIIIIEGNKAFMASFPPLPESRVVRIESDLMTLNSACNRGYIGTWEIEDGKLYLNKIKSERYELTGRYPVFAEWFTGTLKVNLGKLLKFVCSTYTPVYVKDLRIMIEKGVVTNSLVIDNRRKRVEGFKIIKDYFPSFKKDP